MRVPPAAIAATSAAGGETAAANSSMLSIVVCRRVAYNCSFRVRHTQLAISGAAARTTPYACAVSSEGTARILDGRLKLRHLVLITTIASHGSLVAAADALRVTQPVVTRGLRDAEEAVGVQLFDRGPRGVKPTPFGEIMIDHAISALANIRNAGIQIQELRRVGVRPVRVGTNLAGAMALLPKALVVLKDAQPHLTTSVVEGQPEDLTAMLLRGDLDVVVGRIHGGKWPDALRHIKLYDEPVRITARRGHPAFTNGAAQLADLLHYPWILPGPGSRLREELDEVFSLLALAPPRNLMECSTIPTVREILLETEAVAPLPLLVVAGDDQLDAIDVSLDTVPRSIGISFLADPAPSGGTSELIDYLIQVADEIARVNHLTSRTKAAR